MTPDHNPTKPAGTETSSSVSSGLLAQAKVRDPEAWSRLVKLHGTLVYGWSRHSGLTAEEADDIVQEVFSAVALHLDTFRRDRPGDSFRAWLATITRHKIHDLHRRRRNAVAGEGGTAAQRRLLETPEPSLSSEAPEGVQPRWHRALERVQAEFEDRTWQAFWRVVVDGHAPAEVAQEMNLSIHAVYKAKARVLRRVRQELNGLENVE